MGSHAIVYARALCSLLVLVNSAISAFAQGNLNPPGPPAPTMKTLDQIEPRRPISSVPYAITNSGSYYLTTNLSASGAVDGITISADYVTLDLGGFVLTGFGTLNSAIYTPANRQTLVIRNGIIRSWGAGVNVNKASNCHFENLIISDCTAVVGLQAANDCIAINCIVKSNYDGIIMGNNCNLARCAAGGNQLSGISVGQGSIVIGCSAVYNSGTGITLGGDCTATECSSVSSSGSGIILGDRCSLDHCKATGNSAIGISANQYCAISGCSVSGNSSNGISVLDYSTVSDCSVSANATTGIRVTRWCQVLRNLCTFNGFATFTNEAILVTDAGNRVEANNLFNNNNRGLRVTGTANLILKNSAQNGVNYDIAPGNAVGEILNYSAGGTLSSANAWANFQF